MNNNDTTAEDKINALKIHNEFARVKEEIWTEAYQQGKSDGIKQQAKMDCENCKQWERGFNEGIKQERDFSRELIRAVIWKIAQDEGGHILHYNDWVDDNLDKLEQELKSQLQEEKHE